MLASTTFPEPNIRHRRRLLAAALALVTGPALAVNGLFQDSYSTLAKGMAGASAARAGDPSDIATNPAGLLGSGNQLALGIGLFRPRLAYEVSGESPPVSLEPGGLLDLLDPNNPPIQINPFPLEQGSFVSRRRYFPVPHAAASWQMDERWALGIALYGNGSPLAYPDFANDDCSFQSLFLPTEDRGTYCAGEIESLLIQAFVAPSVAYRWENWRLGLSLLLVSQVFEARGFESFGPVSQAPSALSGNGLDESFGVGTRLGFQGEIWPGLSIGGAWSPEISMSAFDDYRGLIANDGRLDIPENWQIGIAWQAPAGLTLAADVQHIAYAGIEALANPVDSLEVNPEGFVIPGTDPVADGALGAADGPGLGWTDMTVYKFGVEWRAAPAWRLRAGYSHADAPIDGEDVFQGLLAPATTEDHYTAGLSYDWSSTLALDMALLYVPEERLTGPNPFAAGQDITLRMRQSEIEFSLRWSPAAE